MRFLHLHKYYNKICFVMKTFLIQRYVVCAQKPAQLLFNINIFYILKSNKKILLALNALVE